MLFPVPVVAEGVDQQSPREPFSRRIGGEDERSRQVGHGGHFVDEDIGRAAFPTLVFVKGPAGLLKAHFLDELVGALNERFNAFRGANGTSGDGVIRARQWFSGAPLGNESRRSGAK